MFRKGYARFTSFCSHYSGDGHTRHVRHFAERDGDRLHPGEGRGLATPGASRPALRHAPGSLHSRGPSRHQQTQGTAVLSGTPEIVD